MSQAARKIAELPIARTRDYLGPAHVIAVRGAAIEVEIRGGERAEATMALAFPYAPEVGDVLLVIGKDDEHYVIGVIHGKGQTSLSFPGAVDLRAQGGPLTLSSDQGVSIQGPAVEVQAGKLEVYAGAVVQKFTSLYQRVREMLSVRAKQAHTIVDEQSLLTAKTAAIVTEEAMNINGSEIHLG
ncbi:MAG: DUF3540 domain-containing protein [Minicystis sp.]